MAMYSLFLLLAPPSTTYSMCQCDLSCHLLPSYLVLIIQRWVVRDGINRVVGMCGVQSAIIGRRWVLEGSGSPPMLPKGPSERGGGAPPV